MNAPIRLPARLASAALMEGLLLARAAQAQRVGSGEGARLPPGPARAPVELAELVEPRGDGQVVRITPLGWRTARVALPRVLADLPADDPRRLAALRYATLHEQVGAVPARGMEGGGIGRVSDGGAAWRVDLAAELRAMQRCLFGLALPVQRGRHGSARTPVPLRAAVDAVCLHGQEVKAVLRAHGWAPHGQVVAVLREVLHQALDRMALQGQPASR